MALRNQDLSPLFFKLQFRFTKVSRRSMSIGFLMQSLAPYFSNRFTGGVVILNNDDIRKATHSLNQNKRLFKVQTLRRTFELRGRQEPYTADLRNETGTKGRAWLATSPLSYRARAKQAKPSDSLPQAHS